MIERDYVVDLWNKIIDFSQMQFIYDMIVYGIYILVEYRAARKFAIIAN